MFNHLPASSGARRGVFTGKTAIPSLIFHGLLIAGGVYATVRAEETKKEEELVEFVDIEEQKPEPEAPKPDEPEPPPPPPAATQAIEPPAEPPASIPAVDLSAPAVSAEDFTGIGVVAPEAAPAPPAAPPPEAAPDFAYEVAVLERVPELSNKGAIGSIMERLYPRLLQDAGIGGTVVMQFVIEPDGTVDMSSAKVLESSNEQLSEASMKAIERFRFRPGRYKGENVRVLIQMPITWQPAG
jgi:periplasmic protein TonB